MKLLLFGADGQLGREVDKRASALGWEIISPLISELDIGDGEAVLRRTAQAAPELIINCAAYTDVDKAESQRELAYRVNAEGAGNIAQAASACGARLLHISTDFVFDGMGKTLLDEQSRVNPVSVYGASKLKGEELVRQAWESKSLILRTSSLHGALGNNFVHTMVRLFSERESVKVISDRFMSATWAGFLADVLIELGQGQATGIVHASCAGALTWFDFAAEIKKVLERSLPKVAKVSLVPVSSAEFPLPARRPEFSAFNLGRLTSLLGREPIDWRQGLYAHLGELGYV